MDVIEDITAEDTDLATLGMVIAFDPSGIPALVVDRRAVVLSSLVAIRTFS